MTRAWPVVLAMIVALCWWALDYVIPRWGWMMDRAAMCVLVGIGIALLAERIMEDDDGMD